MNLTRVIFLKNHNLYRQLSTPFHVCDLCGGFAYDCETSTQPERRKPRCDKCIQCNSWKCVLLLTSLFIQGFDIAIKGQFRINFDFQQLWAFTITYFNLPSFKCLFSFVLARRWYFSGFALRRLSVNHFKKASDPCSSSFSRVPRCLLVVWRVLSSA